MADLPSKLFFRIGEVAGLVGVEPHVLRYWEREFRSIRPTKSAKGQRVYSRKDVENLLRVRDLLYRDGFTIAGAKKKLHHGGAHTATPAAASDADVRDLAEGDGEDPADSDAPASVPDGVAIHAPTVLAIAAAAAPSEVPSSSERASEEARVRDKLVALRGEVEAFLAELSASTRR